MKYYQSLFFSGFMFFTACSCQIPTTAGGADTEEQSLTVMTWNIQNLFDAISSGNEYKEYDPERSDWGEDLLRIRLEHCKEVIQSIGADGPDILLIQEVENYSLLERLNREYLKELYPYGAVYEFTENAIHCGFLSRIPPTNVHLHFPGDYGDFPLRAIMEIHFPLNGGEELVILNNHWKSRSGGSLATESGRLQAAGMISERIRELKEDGQKLILVAGDLNGSCSDYRPGGRQTAQIPVEYVPDTFWQDSLYIAQSREDMMDLDDRTILFSPWKTTDDQGSYFFQNRWMTLDHFLLSSAFLDGTGWEFGRMDCLNESWLCDKDGHPFSWKNWTASGYSDHFPLVLNLERGCSE
jgi:endonuclease/exonuclease/phosphatase family metal-dependent hydrolase